jgi:hypothetical protein
MNLANKVPAMLLARGDRMDYILLHHICRFLADIVAKVFLHW